MVVYGCYDQNHPEVFRTDTDIATDKNRHNTLQVLLIFGFILSGIGLPIVIGMICSMPATVGGPRHI
jgi:hypothetical protein